MKVRGLMAILLLGGLLCGCTKEEILYTNTADMEAGKVSDTGQVGADVAGNTVSNADMFTERDLRMTYEEKGSVQIFLKENTIEANAEGVVIEGSTATITRGGTYIISGCLQDGMLVIDAADTEKVQIVLDNVSIHSESSAAIYVKNADKVFLTVAESSVNELSNGGSFESIDDNNIDAVLFAKQDITINGLGSLKLSSPIGHGIVAKDDLVIVGAELNIMAASHAIEANDSTRIADATMNMKAGKDGIHVENSEEESLGFVYLENASLMIEAEGDGISASSFLQVAGGEIEIVAGGGSENAAKHSSDNWGGFPGGAGMFERRNPMESGAAGDDDRVSMKGLKAEKSILIAEGNFAIDAADDAIHSNQELAITGGCFKIATGDDGIHAEETLTITGGTIHISESYEGLEAVHIVVEGGNLSLIASDDGLNAAGGVDASGTEGGRDGMFGNMGGHGKTGGGRGGMHGGASNGSIVISGGNIEIQASGDGIDANGSLEITGGYVVIAGPTRGDTATLDYDTSAIISGGTFIGTGANNMAQSFSDATQGVIAVSVGNQASGTTIVVSDKEGVEKISHTPQLDYQVVIFSSPQLKTGETYTMTIGTESAYVKGQ